MIQLFGYELDPAGFIILGTVPVLIGMAKTGVHGAGMIAVPMLAIAFGGKRVAVQCPEGYEWWEVRHLLPSFCVVVQGTRARVPLSPMWL